VGDEEKAPQLSPAPKQTPTLTPSPQEKAVDAVLNKLGAPDIDPQKKQELIRALSTVDLQKDHPEKNERILTIASDQLKAWGFKVNDIDRGTLKLETPVDKKAAEINELARQGAMPTEKYKSNVGIYGFETTKKGDMLEYKKTPLQNLIDKFANLLLIAGDSGGNIFTALFKKGIRRKQDMNGIADNINELGLSSDFEVDKQGNGVSAIREKTDDLKQGAFLDDLLRKGGDDYLKQFDGVSAIKAATKMVADVHKKSNRGIGELLGNDIVLKVKDGKIEGARLTLPDAAYEKTVPVDEQKAMDLIDLCYSVGSAGMQRGGDAEAKKFIEAVIHTYPNANVKTAMKKLTAASKPYSTLYNMTRYGFDRVKNKDDAFKKVAKMVKGAL